MELKEFQTESKRLLDLMINSIYTHKEIFLRELISNASDAVDKIYYKALTDDTIQFCKDDYYIRISADKEKRLLTVSDTGIGMTREELEGNLGTIAQSGSSAFKQENQSQEGHEIIGQFGVGFYSAFMVADVVTVISKAFNEDQAYKWESRGVEGYTIQPWEKESTGTDVILKIKESTEDENYDEFLEEYRLREIIKKYSDFIRYPIKMDVTRSRLKEGSDSEYEEYTAEEIVNSMVPIWKKNKNELTPEDYENFYTEKRYGFDKPLKYVHTSAEGMVSYNAILYIPATIPYDYYSPDYEKGLELYSNGVLIMNKCPELLPDYFSFVKGMVESDDLSLNISREMLQHDRQLKLIAKNIQGKIKNALLELLNEDREKYEKFFTAFGRQLKYSVYAEFGRNKDVLEDLLLFYSSKEKKMVTLEEYCAAMPEDQKYIYYAAGETVEKLDKQPQTEFVRDKGYDILFLTEDVDEFALKILGAYKEKEFKSVSSGDLGLEEKDTEPDETGSEIFTAMKEILGDKVKEVRASKRLKTHPVCLANAGELSIDMEKTLNAMPNAPGFKAEKILEINTGHDVYRALENAHEQDTEKFKLFTELLYNQALLIEGLPVEDPVDYTNKVCQIMK
ncbi:MAG TPA: molecular chaperone HtpG [Bacillota bacterium]|nr:molecular chaperone HtpG [Bacillota bacterium]HPZ22805.1 molecular chaperone HtpG [Bacillota bacterium]